jgi:hypothetical protein
MKALMYVCAFGLALAVVGCPREDKPSTDTPEKVSGPSSTPTETQRPSPRGGTQDAAENAAVLRARTSVEKLSGAVTLYAVSEGTPPEALRSLVEAGLVTSSSLRDPWGQAMSLSLLPKGRKTHKVCSSGPDRRMGTVDDLCASD